jgi:hypothetical protein
MEVAVAAVLTEPSMERAAAKAGVSMRTLRRWKREPQFQRALREARLNILEETGNLYLAMGKRAAVVVYESMEDNKPPVVRLRAAEHVAEAIEKLVGLVDVRAELDELWAALGGKHRTQRISSRAAAAPNGHQRPGGQPGC